MRGRLYTPHTQMTTVKSIRRIITLAGADGKCTECVVSGNIAIVCHVTHSDCLSKLTFQMLLSFSSVFTPCFFHFLSLSSFSPYTLSLFDVSLLFFWLYFFSFPFRSPTFLVSPPLSLSFPKMFYSFYRTHSHSPTLSNF